MAKGDHLTRHQKSIVRRYYEHADTRTVQKLQEIVSDLAMAPDEKTAARLWKSAETALTNAGLDEAALRRAVGARKPEDLARAVAQLAAKK